jgi:Protein of unknown function (DUF1565)
LSKKLNSVGCKLIENQLMVFLKHFATMSLKKANLIRFLNITGVKMKKIKKYLASSFILILGCIFCLSSTFLLASPTTNTYVASSYTTLSGSDNHGPVQNLQTLDSIGMNLGSAYVQFQAKTAGSIYNGYRSYFIPPHSPITALQVFANYKGASSTTQNWTWKIYDWVYEGWVSIGTNAMVIDQGPWAVLNFNVGGPWTNYVNSNTGELRIGFSSNNTANDALLNYEAVVVTTDSTAPSPGASYFVSTTGKDSNAGTLNSPWQTISHAASVVSAGGTVYVRGGVYSERVVFKNSGSAKAGPITFMSYPGETAIVDGTNVKLPTAPGAGPSGLFQLTNVNYITVQGFEIRNVISSKSSLFSAGLAIEGQCDHIEIRSNHIHDISNGKYGAHGLGVYGTSSPQGVTNLVIDGNELNTLTLGQSESLTVNGNVQYWTISNNIVHDSDNIGIDAIGFERTASTAYDQARNGSITGNLVYNINDNKNAAYPKNDNSADGIYVDGGASILIEGNIVHHSNIGIELASEHKGRNTSNIIARNNLVYLNTGPGFSLGGYSKKTGGTDQCTVVNNTFFGNDTLMTGSGEVQFQYFPAGVSNNIFENNILYTNKQNLLISNPFSSPIVKLDYNLYYTPSGKSPDWQWNKKDYSSLSQYQKASGGDSHSLFADPQFVNTTTPILYVLSTSPAINAGSDLGPDIVGNTDVSGHPREQSSHIDIGAYEQ